MSSKDKPKKDEPFFVGWAPTDKIDRRFLLRASLSLIAIGAGAGALVAAVQLPPGDGMWNPDDERDWAGLVVRDPYPMLRTRALDGTPRTAFVVSSSKRGVQQRLGDFAGPAVIRGSLIARGKNAMIAVSDEPTWLRAANEQEVAQIGGGLAAWQAADRGAVVYRGEILDSKCWFGAMRPGQGKPHKSCAALCIRGGLPPVFCLGDLCGTGENIPLLTDAAGAPHGLDLLALVGDPVIASGRLMQTGDVTEFRVDLADIRRL